MAALNSREQSDRAEDRKLFDRLISGFCEK
jgi:hypothetical protein